jgi:hypothetical protein
MPAILQGQAVSAPCKRSSYEKQDEGDQIQQQGDQISRLSPLFHEDDQDDQVIIDHLDHLPGQMEFALHCGLTTVLDAIAWSFGYFLGFFQYRFAERDLTSA